LKLRVLAMNFLTLVKAVDAVIAFTDAAKRFRNGGSAPAVPPPGTDLTPGAPAASGLAGQIEARLTNVVVAALKEAFDRDHARLELERAQLDEQRRRADEALKAEVQRQAAEREIARLRLIAGTALVGWLASVLVLGLRAAEASVLARSALAVGWVLLLVSLGTAFTAQGRVEATPSRHAAVAVWLLIAGLAVTAVSLLL
jgi:hypothetical protein